MPKRVPVNTIIVKRDGKNFVPPIGKPFDFTQDELNDINAVMPGAVRKIINEAPDEVEKAPAATQETKKTGRGQGRQAAQPAGSGDGEGAASGSGDGDL